MNFYKLREGYGNISKRLDILRSTVQSIVKKFKESGTTDTLPGGGRKQKLTNLRILVSDIAENLKEQGIEIRTRTIQRTHLIRMV